MKKTLLIIGIITAIPLVLIAIFLFVITGAIFMFNPNPPAPAVIYGEFPITVTYQVNDEVKTINDVVICEFDGFENRGSAGNYRVWKEQLKSGKDMIPLLDLRDKNYFTDWGTQVLEICLDPGCAEYYLSEESPTFGPPGPPNDEWIDYLYITQDGKYGYSAFKRDETWEKFKIKILNIEYTQPIENSFK